MEKNQHAKLADASVEWVRPSIEEVGTVVDITLGGNYGLQQDGGSRYCFCCVAI
ncbi:hypothetical protein [Pseudonocardia acaciae]|uniref:hypothetical protein n=1 Tax=Pseudonocardia acaciae TaxID=551276 RepID=UPI0012EDA9A3|nr:hypothetical protein [Pseudonocardia acaciae]